MVFVNSFSRPFFGLKIDPVLDGFLDRFWSENEPQINQKSIKTCFFCCFFCDAFFLRFFWISAQFSRSPNLRNRAHAYSRALFSRNRHFRFRTSFRMDFTSFWPHFRPKNASKWAPGPSREKNRFWVPILSIFWSIWGPIWSPWGGHFRQKARRTSAERTFWPSGTPRGRFWSLRG